MVVGLAVTQLLTACATTPAGKGAAARPEVTAQIVQLRRDQVLERVEVSLDNSGADDVVVEHIALTVPGFAPQGPVGKDSPVPAGQVVNLPVPYGEVGCPAAGPPRVGRPTVTLRLRTGPRVRTLRVTARDPDGLLQRIATRACAVREVSRQVRLRLGDRWRLERTPEGTVAHGLLQVRHVAGPAREVTQVAGAIMYGLRPGAGAAGPLATVSPARPVARVPVVVWAARCDGHTIGEIKKPFEFLVWVSRPDGDDLAVTPSVGEPTKAALRHVCAF